MTPPWLQNQHSLIFTQATNMPQYTDIARGTNKPTMTQEQFTKLMNSPELKGKPTSEVLSFLRFKGIDVQGVDFMKPAKDVTAPEVPTSYGLGAMSAVGTGGLTTAGRLIGSAMNLGGLAPNAAGNFMLKTADQMEQALPAANQEVTGVKAGGMIDKAGQFLGKAAVTGTAGLALGAGKLAGGAEKLAGTYLGKGLGMPTLAKMLGFSAGSLIETPTWTYGDEGRAPTAGEMGWNAAFAAAIPMVSGIFSSLKKVGGKATDALGTYLSNSTDANFKKLEPMLDPESLNVLKQVADTPEAKDLSKYYKLAQESVEDSTKMSPVKEVSDDLLSGFKAADAELKKTGEEIGNLVKSAKNTVVPETESILNTLTEDLNKLNIQPSVSTTTTPESVVSKLGGIPTKTSSETISKLTPESFANSTIQYDKTSQNTLIKVYNDLVDKIKSGGQMTLEEIWYDKQSLQGLTSFNPNMEKQISDAAETPVIGLIKKLDSILTDEGTGIKGLSDLNQKYGLLSETVNFVNKKIGPDGAKGVGLANAIFKEADTRAMDAAKILGGYINQDIVRKAQLVKVAMELAGDNTTSSWFGAMAKAITNPKTSIVEGLNQAFGTSKKELVNAVLGQIPEAKTLPPSVLEQIVTTVMKSLNMEGSTQADIGQPEA